MTTSRRADSSAMEAAAIRHLHDGAGCTVVAAAVEGRPVLFAFKPDSYEHLRRTEEAIGAVRSRRLLHALWALPHQVPWPVSGLGPVDASTLESREAAGFVSVNADIFTRLYQPPGQVVAIGLRGGRLADAVRRASLFPAIFSRYAIGTRPSRGDNDALAIAAAHGIGTALTGPTGLIAHTCAAAPHKGAPGVYRWWMAEVAYEAWLTRMSTD